MTKKYKEKMPWSVFFMTLSLSSLFFGLWVFLTPLKTIRGGAQISDQLRLIANKKMIEKFVAEFQISPVSMREVAIYSEDYTFYLYDQSGERLDYHPLTDRDWLLRAFGPDGMENTLLSAPDYYVSSFSDKPLHGVMYTWPGKPHFFPAPVLSGSYSPDRKKFARIYQHDYLEQSLLLVRLADSDSFSLISFHDRVEEFLWLPDSGSIVFTAVGSERYRDGIYLWNLRTNTTNQLLSKGDLSFWQNDASREQQWFLSLAGISDEGLLYSFVAPRNESSLSLDGYFSGTWFRIFNLDRNGEELKNRGMGYIISPDEMSFGLIEAVNCFDGLGLQQEWCDLPLKGGFDEVLEKWQLFSQEVSNTPVFSYSMWVLSMIYHDAYALWNQLSPAEKRKLSQEKVDEVLASYGAEIAQTLGEQPLTPHWIKAMAVYFWEMFVARESLSFRLTDLVLKPQNSEME